MNDGLKQRLVGAILLVALAVIFLPMLLDFSGGRDIDKSFRIPGPPPIEPLTFAEPKRPDNTRYPKPPDRAFRLDQSRAEVEQAEMEQAEELAQTPGQPDVEPQPEPEPAGLTEHGVLAGWVIQVGAFSDPERAGKLEASLQEDGYKAYRQENRSRALHFVYVGPDADQKSLLQTQKKIDSKYRLKSKMLRFEP